MSLYHINDFLHRLRAGSLASGDTRLLHIINLPSLSLPLQILLAEELLSKQLLLIKQPGS